MANHIDLFTGIGGFTLACYWHGIQTDVMCEIDERCRQFLERQWPGISIIPDIRDFDGSKWRGRFLLTGGVPCQPASRAGKQRGKGDDRWLWSEAIRVVKEAEPRWCLFENPPGIYDVGIDGILSDLEGIGYEVGICEIPACAVNSPQIRQRVWIVAHTAARQCESGAEKMGNNTKTETACDYFNGSSQGDMADTAKHESESGSTQSGQWRMAKTDTWDNSLWLPCADGKVRRAPDDTFGLVDGLHRSLLAALGNSIVPQVAYEIVGAIIYGHQLPSIPNQGQAAQEMPFLR